MRGIVLSVAASLLALAPQARGQAQIGPCPSQQAFMAFAEVLGMREACDRAAPQLKESTASIVAPLVREAQACHEFLAGPGQHRILIGSASSMMENHARKDAGRLCRAELQAGVDRARTLLKP